MRGARCVVAIALITCAAVTAEPGCMRGQEAAQAPLPVTVTLNSRTVPPYEVLELTFQHDRQYADPFFDVTIEVTFTAPGGKQYQVGGFHYGSAERPQVRVQSPGEGQQVEYLLPRANLWKARFAPAELGEWAYEYTFRNLDDEQATGAGTFTCVAGRIRNPGFVRQDPDNPFRWVFDDGTPYYPIGLQEGWGDWIANGSFLDTASMEGPFRTEFHGRPRTDPLPPGPLFQAGPANNPQNADVCLRHFSRCGFNLHRFSQANNTPSLFRDLDHYLVYEAVMTDELLQCLRRYRFRICYGIFGYQSVFNDQPGNAEAMAKLQRFIKYSVDRWGAYVDVWEFLNEQDAADEWYAILAPYLRSLDPYQHPITSSWERPQLPGIEISAPHWYEGIEDELGSDQVTADRAREWKRFGKPVIVGEQGNWIPTDQPRAPGVGGVWDLGSARRMRLRNWTALFNEIAFIFWNTSYAKDGHFMNIWLGPLERQYVKAGQDFAYALGRGLKMAPVEVSQPEAVRAHGLASPERAGVYLHHYANHERAVEGLRVTFDVPRAARGYWYRPEDGAILTALDVAAGRQTVATPPFTVDLALLVTPAGPPDSDGDGLANDLDPDDDNDGVADVQDAFPLEPGETADADGDLIGDNMDADDNGDGVPDDANGNGVADCEEMDLDGDGVNRAGSVPWDAFPLDPQEWRDTDGDGLGDNADADADGDGYTNDEERQAGTDPLDRLSFPLG